LSDLFLFILITSQKREFGSFVRLIFFHYFITLQNRKFGIYLIKDSVLLWIVVSFFLDNLFFCRNQNEANESQINPLKRTLIDSDPPDTPRKRHNSGHKVGFDNNWKLNRPWLECVENSMKCVLCTRHNMKNVWATTGCVSLRLDKIKEHESSTDHINSVSIEVDQNVPKT
jgi:hypothetical protein